MSASRLHCHASAESRGPRAPVAGNTRPTLPLPGDQSSGLHLELPWCKLGFRGDAGARSTRSTSYSASPSPNLWDLSVLLPHDKLVSQQPLHTNRPDYLNVLVRKTLPALIYISIQTPTPFSTEPAKVFFLFLRSPGNAGEACAKFHLRCGKKTLRLMGSLRGGEFERLYNLWHMFTCHYIANVIYYWPLNATFSQRLLINFPHCQTIQHLSVLES